VSWGLITEDWRLKLLAGGLAVLMLGAVAFSQNPPTTVTLSVPLYYSFGTNTGIVIMNPPSKTNVTYTGLADVIKTVNPTNTTATVDATHAAPGSAVMLNVNASTTVRGGISVVTPAPIVVAIDTLTTKDVPVSVNAHPAAGWSISNAFAMCPGKPCVVHFTGPASWEKNLTAGVTYPVPVAFSTGESPTQQVQLQNSNGFLDLTFCRTNPCASVDPPTVTIHIDAVAGSTSSTVPLVIGPPTHPPASGYRITAVTITPNTIVITGDAATVAKTRRIDLSPVDLSGKTSDTPFQIQFTCPADSCSATIATVKYSISPDPNVSPSPGP
jgi:YbbR domain-containing protein